MANTGKFRTKTKLNTSVAHCKPAMEKMVWVPAGIFLMGSDKHYPEEAPAHYVTVDGFWIDQYTVRKCLGVDYGLVSGAQQNLSSLPRNDQPEAWRATPELRSCHAGRTHPAQSD